MTKTTLLSLLCVLVFAASAQARPPNLVLIMADDLGYECIGANGGTSYPTPRIDQLAREGLRFDHGYAQPLCTPSRVQIMTGLYNLRNYTKFGELNRKQTTFAHLLKKQGYATGIAGKWQLGKEPDAPRHFGFDRSCLWQHTQGRTDGEQHDTRYENPALQVDGKPMKIPAGSYGPDLVSDFLCDFMEEHRDQPFLVYYPMILTHCPFVPTPDSPDWDPQSQGCKAYKGEVNYFGDMVSYMDKMVGKLVDQVQALGLEKETLILFTGDNGTDRPVVSMLNGRKVAGAKGSTTDGGTRVPLVAYWPGTIQGGRVSSDLVDFTDLLPTLCEAASAPVPESLGIDGQSFLPLLTGAAYQPRSWIYCWYSRQGKDNQAKIFARNQRFKLYQDGAFFDIQQDVLEQAPLKGKDLNADQQMVRAMLQQVLDRYRDQRRSHLSKR